MKFIDYLNKKYPSGNFGLMALEAKVFRIRYPLQSGWLQKHRDDEISMLQMRELKALLQKKDKEINKRTIEFLNGFFNGGDHLEQLKTAIKWNFPEFIDLKNITDPRPKFATFENVGKFKKQIALRNQLKEKRKA